MSLLKYAANTSWLIAEKVLRIVSGILVSTTVIKYLGPEKLGMLGFSQGFVSLFAALSTLGLESIVIHDLVTDPDKENEILGTAICLRIAGGLAVAVAIGFSLIFLNENSTIKLMIIMLWFSQLLLSFNVIGMYFQAEVIGKKIAVVNLLALGISIISKILIIIMKGPVYMFAATSIIESLAIGFGFVYLYNQQHSIYKWKFQGKIAKDMIKRSLPLMLSIFCTAAAFQLDQVVIKQLLDIKDVGYYIASARITQLFYFIPVILTTSIFPKLIQIKSTIQYNSRLGSFNSLLTLTGSVITVILVTLGSYAITALMGNEFKPSTQLLIYHAMSLVFVFHLSLRKKLLILEKKTNYTIVYSAATATLMVSLLILLVPLYGLTGAGLAHLGAWAISIVLVPIIIGRPQESRLFIESLNPLAIKNAFKNINA